MPYDDLVKWLRNKAGGLDYDGWVDTAVVMEKAADAIEELSRAKEELAKQVAYWQAQLTKSMCGETLAELEKPRWVSVTEHFPDAYEDVLLQFPNNQAAGFCDRDGCWGIYSGDGFYTEVADNEPKPTHWVKKLPEPPKEET